MLKAEYVLEYLRKNKLLLPVCLSLGLNYKHIHNVASRKGNASLNVRKSLSPIISPLHWEEDADGVFINNIKKEISSLFLNKPLVDV